MNVKSNSGFGRRAFVAGAWTLGAVALYASYQVIVRLANVDAFSQFRPGSPGALSRSIGVQLQGAAILQYDGSKLTGSADAETIDVSRDRRSMNLSGVTNGVLVRKGGNVHFSASSAVWDDSLQSVSCNAQAKVWGKQFVIKAPEAGISTLTNVLSVPGDALGTLHGGSVQLTSIQYNLKSGAYETGPISWTGIPAKSDLNLPIAQGQEADKIWHVEGKRSKRGADGIEYYYDGMASDGQTIVRAPVIQRDPKTDVLTATGRVLYYSQKANLAADKVVVYRRDHRAVLTGNVVMIVKPRSEEDKPPTEVPIPPFTPIVPKSVLKTLPPPNAPTPAPETDASRQRRLNDELRTAKTLRDYPMTIRADQVVYWYEKGSRHAEITGSPQGVQVFPDGRWRQMWTYSASWDGEKDLLVMHSQAKDRGVRMLNSIGDNLMARSITISTQDENNGVRQYEAMDLDGDVVDVNHEVPTATEKHSPTNSPPQKPKTPPATSKTKPPISDAPSLSIAGMRR